MPLESSPETPLPVRTVARALGDWIGRLGAVWIEGQLTQITRRPRQSTAFLVLRDTAAEMSLQITCPGRLLDGLDVPLAEGARVVVLGKPEFWAGRGSLSIVASDIRPVGVGALLARLEQLRQVLAAEGLFAPQRKRALPFLPHTVGLVTGRASAAERDVVDNAQRRWPAVMFRIENVAVQGPYAVTEILSALQRLDTDPAVDVIVMARGGGSMEDLLPFSDEALVRAVSSALTPVISAIGHEADVPLLDHVADRRASTPTDAAKLLVPDVREEIQRIEALQSRGRRVVAARIDGEQHRLDLVRTRPSIADPATVLSHWAQQTASLRERGRRAGLASIAQAAAQCGRLTARITALSPQATLDRGYAVLQRADGHVVRAHTDVRVGDRLRGRVATGRLTLSVEELT